MPGNQDYLAPKVKGPASRVVQQFNGQFRNPPAYEEFGGFYDKNCLNVHHATEGVEKVPTTRVGRPI